MSMDSSYFGRTVFQSLDNERNYASTRGESEKIAGSTSFKSNKDSPIKQPGPPRPLVAKISLWTPRNGKLEPLTRRGQDDGGDDGNNDDENRRHRSSRGGGGEDDDDDDDDDDSDNDAFGSDLDLDQDINDTAQLEQRLVDANLPEHVRAMAMKELQRMRRMPSFMSESTILRYYLELIAELPWTTSSEERIDLAKSRRDLDNDHYGMSKLKERVLQYLAVRKLKESQQVATGSPRASKQPILAFVGPPGTGKTSIAQSIASSLGRKFQRISLGGVSDQASIRGHRRTYIGAMPGRIIEAIKHAGVNNPVVLLDEVDKICCGTQGDPAGALLEVLDPEQNHTFVDHYLNIAFDLSRVLFIATANSVETIPPALLDRMELIQLAGYTHDEKFNIARRHLVPKQVLENGLRPGEIVFRDEALQQLIANYAREAGVRTLERRIGTICRAVAVRVVESAQAAATCDRSISTAPRAVLIDADSLEHFLGPAVYERESAARANVPGVAIGLAWTAAGGEITFVEAEIMKGARRESLVLTGQLGSVMRESCVLALNWLRANFHHYDALPSSLGRELVENTVHVHFPAGAVGKDGPSAGVTIVCALMSLCSKLPLASDLAMSGEITLRGVVLKVGGVKSKVLAAHRAGIRRIILPARNESDLNEVPASVKDAIKFHFVANIDELIRAAFDGKLVPRANLIPESNLTSKL